MQKKIIHYLTQCIVIIAGFITLVILLIKNIKQVQKNIEIEERANNNSSVIKTFNLWMEHKQKNKEILYFFKKNNFNKIAIYGMHYLGERVLDELHQTEIEVKYAIDRNPNLNKSGDIKVVKPNGHLDMVDAIVVTPVYYFDEIERQLSSHIDCPIVSLEEVIRNS